MREDGIEKILAGLTAFDEVERVVDLEREGAQIIPMTLRVIGISAIHF
jgi:hypothetical protein